MSVVINETNFPYEKFRSYVSQWYDLDGDGILSDEEISYVKTFSADHFDHNNSSTKYKDDRVDGLDFFTELETIELRGQYLYGFSFDSFKKLKKLSATSIVGRPTTDIDFRGCISLTELTFGAHTFRTVYLPPSLEKAAIGQGWAYADQWYPNTDIVSSIDFSPCTKLKSITLRNFDNPGGTNCTLTVNISGLNNHPTLEKLDVSDSDSITELDLSNCQALTYCSIINCANLVSLDSSGCTELVNFNSASCSGLQTLNISGCSNLENFRCTDNNLRPSLDLSSCPKLQTIRLSNTNLSFLTLGEKPDLRLLQCFTKTSKIAIRSLDISGCPYFTRMMFRIVNKEYTVNSVQYSWRGGKINSSTIETDPYNEDFAYDSRTTIDNIPINVPDGLDTTLSVDFPLVASDTTSDGDKYWWYCNGENISKTKYPQYSFAVDKSQDGNVYHCNCRIWTSNKFVLVVLDPPEIDENPSDIVVANGRDATFSVSATDPYDAELSYQWEYSNDNNTWSEIAENGTSASYSFVASLSDDRKFFRCSVTSPVCTVVSSSAQLRVVTEPVISVHPVTQVVATGSTVTVSIAAEGGVLSFQWQVSTNGETWTPVDGAASSEYSFVASRSDSGKQYRCIATNVAGSDISDPATLTVYDPPAIVSRSVIPECVAENSEVSLSVSVSGDDLHYQWQESANFGAWVPIDEATSSTYSFTASRADTGKRYRCYVYNDVGNVICDIYDDPANAENGPTSITVVYEPVVSPEGSSSVVRTGNRASFSISAEGGRLTYKWQVSSNNGSTWTDIPNATEDTYAFTATKSDSGKQYRCQVTNIAGTTYSVAITLTVLDPPVINSELSIPDVGDGTEVRLQSDASGDELEYKWQISANGTDWADIAENGTGQTYSFTASVSQNHTYYRYQVFNRVGEETSNAAQLFVITRPNITSQPESQVVVVQSQVSFSVGTEGEHLNRKWQVSSNNGSTWTDIPNATEDTYAFTAAKSDSGKQYRCQVTNIAGTVESDPAHLTVLYEPAIVTNPEFPNRVTAGDYVHCDADAHGDELQHQWYVKYAGIDQWYPIGIENSDIYTDSVTYEHEPHQENGEWVSGARFVRLAFYVAPEFTGNKYYCEFWNDVGRTQTQETNELYVLCMPTIKSVNAPESAVRTGNPVSLSVVADGGDLSYQWQISVDNGVSWQNVVDGGKASTYSFTATVSQNGYQYQCIVTNVVGSATCAPISLKVQAAPSISAGPVSQSVGLDTTVTFTAAINGTDLVYQWQVSSDSGATWIDIGDTDAPSYSLTAGIEKDGHMYRCRASNDLGFVVTGSALLTVLSFPEIITQPSSATVEYASNVVFLVAATGGELAYQWEYSFDNGVTWTKITKNGTNTTYSFLAVDSQNGYLYHCIVGNKLGTVTSEAASLTVLGSATTEEEIPVLVFAGKYLPSQMAAMIRELPIGANLDEIAFGARAVETLHASIGRTGSTDPRYYEEIAESINELKSLIAQLQSQNPSS